MGEERITEAEARQAIAKDLNEDITEDLSLYERGEQREDGYTIYCIDELQYKLVAIKPTKYGYSINYEVYEDDGGFLVY